MTEIVLPIKCSTVKKIFDLADTIADYEMVLLGIVMWLWSAINIYRIIVAPYSMSTEISAAAVSIILFFVGCGVWCILIYEALPTITCIKDDEEKE